MQDYKFDLKLNGQRGKSRRRAGVFIAASMLAGTLAALGFHDTDASLTAFSDTHSQPSPQETRLQAQTPQPIRMALPLPAPGHDQAPVAKAAHEEPRPAAPAQGPSLLQPDAIKTAPVIKHLTKPAPTGNVKAAQTAGKTTATLPKTGAVRVDPKPVAVATAESPSQSAPRSTSSWKKHKIKQGESLASIFKAYQLSSVTLYRILHSSEDAKSLSRIRPGQQLEMQIDDDGTLQKLILVRSPVERLMVSRQDGRYQSQLANKKIEHKVATVTGTIESSLFVDGQKAGLTDSQIMELAEVFGWDIDFALEIRAGDQFRVIYDQQFVDGEKYRSGPILAAEFVNRGKTYQAFRYQSKNQIGYYDADGHSKRRAFIRTPIRFARISSRFTPKRWHPILKKWKSHRGVDYAAPTGTPIKATGNGRVIFRGWQRGYGRIVILQHSSKYRTAYAHMSKFRSSVKKGTRVKQGQVIGYVGKSGWATGPHLHYEFRVNNVQRNPLTVKLPKSLPLPKRQLASFKRKIAPLTQQLASIRQATMVASAGD